MLNDLLTKFYSGYLTLNQFETTEEFDTFYNKYWLEFDEMNLEETERNIIRSEIINGSHSSPNDEKERLAFLHRRFQISALAANISLPINEKVSLDLQTAMFNHTISEIELLYSQLKEKEFLITKYPFILEELSVLRQQLYIKCGHLGNSSLVFQSHQIKWTGSKNTLAALFWDLWKGQSKEINNRSTDLEPLIEAKSARIIQEFLAANFTDLNGKHWEAKEFDDYFKKGNEKERGETQKRIRMLYKK